MASSINATHPAENADLDSSPIRDNFAAAKSEIEALQADVTGKADLSGDTFSGVLAAPRVDLDSGSTIIPSFSQEVTGQLINFGTNYSQGAGHNGTNDGAFFRIETRSLYSPNELFNVKFIPAGGAEVTIFEAGTASLRWRGHDVQTISGQSGGTDGRVVRMTGTNDTWTDASQADTADQLASLAFKVDGFYLMYGSKVTGLSSLTAGTVYYLSTAGNLTSTAPTPSSSVRLVRIGTAINTTTLYFTPGIPIGGE